MYYAKLLRLTYTKDFNRGFTNTQSESRVRFKRIIDAYFIIKATGKPLVVNIEHCHKRN